MKMNFRITELSSHGEALLHTCETGRVHSIYRNTCNIRLENELLALQTSGSVLSPLSLITECSFFQKDFFASGQVTVSYPFLFFGPEVSFSCQCAAMTDTVLSATCFSAEELASLIRAAMCGRGCSGFAPALFPSTSRDADSDILLSYVKSCLADCAALFSTSEYARAAYVLCKLIGLGIGLTPSGDDFLCGVLAGAHLMCQTGHPFIRQLSARLSECLSLTNDISQSFLTLALQGQFSRPVLLLQKEIEPELLYRNFQAIGHSSGLDTLCGIFFISRLFIAKEQPHFPH